MLMKQDSRAALVGLLELIGREIEVSESQRELAAARYEAVGSWLAGSKHPWLGTSYVYPHGSFALGTPVRPISEKEFDVDLVVYMPMASSQDEARLVKQIVGDRLREHGLYAGILIQKNRCWRLDYANEFHLDITPSVPADTSVPTAEFVPDRESRCWTSTNPRGYCAWFESEARLFAVAKEGLRADVEPFPEKLRFGGPLRRIVQLLKRHRDLHFEAVSENAPISIVVTTLAAQSFEAAAAFATEDELELLLRTLRGMVDYIRLDPQQGWVIPNPSQPSENFADKWNADPNLPVGFFSWHGKLVKEFEALARAEAIDAIGNLAEKMLGTAPVRRALSQWSDAVGRSRAAGILRASTVGLVNTGSGVTVPRNTFFGR